ncbi:PLDc N-terminal domain-containing protein [Ornithinimicrobium cerasi]|uniref:Phospholipase_D-nuclease N-terminal n=1 Tax=Ornithinimicrobium cerasi TaxID=2248773 RepID=A0A285VT26_9MICO|nr:PLDc N-terminal domain-containing protein [Ornithinimicrobium cerasi]SOC56386.1 Phospholipase_D-nuclease N-terminal [Ornithinimicrobium cerasi]
MPRVIAAVAVLAFTIFCVVDAVQTDEHEVRGLPKPLWIVMILLFPLVGGAVWLIAGRPNGILDLILNGRRRGGPPRGPLGPDDDPDFLKGL